MIGPDMQAATFTGYNFNDVYPKMVTRCLAFGEESAPRGKPIKELHPAFVEVFHPDEHLITSFGRPINVAFALAEVLWILGGREDVHMLEFYNSNIRQFSDNGVTFNAPYGYRLRHAFGHDQIEDVVRTLTEDPDSRQAILQIWKPEKDRGHEIRDGRVIRRQTKDRACNINAMLLLREGKLNWVQIQRSNDLIWGTPYNYMQWSHVQKWIAELLGVEVGRFTHVVNSLHLYTEDYAGLDAAEGIAPFDLYLAVEEPERDWGEVSVELVDDLMDLEHEIRTAPSYGYSSSRKGITKVPPYWQSVMWLTYAHRLYQDNQDEATIEVLSEKPDPVYGCSQLRFYWHHRWSKAPERAHYERLIKQSVPPPVYGWILRHG